jgi:hypothetical protein
MSIETLEQLERRLFDEWRAREPDLVTDGVIKESAFLQARCRIVFVLKEVNSAEGGWDLRENIQKSLEEGGGGQFLKNLVQWTLGIMHWDKEISWADLEKMVGDKEQRRNSLSATCVMNLKKTPGKGTAETNAVAEAAEKYGPFLRRQLGFYLDVGPDSVPRIIICGGTGRIFKKVVAPHMNFEWEKTKRGIEYLTIDTEAQKYIIVNFWHPECRTGSMLLYYALFDAVGEILHAGA